MGIYDNADSSYKAAGAETYYLPVLYTEDERSSYAAWGIKKEKLLMPFAIVTIIIDAFVLCATVVYLFAVQRQTPAFSVWLSCWGGVVGDVSYGVALVLTVLILKPLDWLFDKIMHRPEQPRMLQVTPKETGVSYLILRGTAVLARGLLPWEAWEDALAVETNEILLEGQRLRIGSNTIDAMKSGMLYGHASMLDGMIDRAERELGRKCTIVATGIPAKRLIPFCRHDIFIDEDLMLKGLRVIYKKNL